MGMDPQVVKTLHDAFRKAQADPTFLAAMDKFDMPIIYMGPEEFTKARAACYIEAGERVRKFVLGK